ncbi:MAG TPA: phosphoribosylamine--glycine ligase, partial [Saprospiraceae bacterium]|nr:phosphoribosylamine--glycine ligase [Saprospiraceae bacterium]
MNVLILGSGAREHAFAYQLATSSLLKTLYIAPGNAGTAQIGTNISLSLTDFKAVKKALITHQIDIVLVGPEVPLVAGIHDFIASDPELKHLLVIGPKKEGAQLEGSKAFAKEFMIRHQIPTAKYRSFTGDSLQEAFVFLEHLKPPYVLKADGLAAGKGVLILEDIDKAKDELTQMLTQEKFGLAGHTVVIEEYLDGIEMSCFALVDGADYVVLPNAKDYKRIGEGDTGLNTGGMGAISPVPFADATLLQKIEQQIIKPTIQGLQEEGIAYQGFLFFGLMIVRNEPFVIEYNVRMGDPETEVVLPRLETDLLTLFKAIKEHNLAEQFVKVTPLSAATVMAVSGGYPEQYEKGKVITGLANSKNSDVFHAGTQHNNDV